MRINAIKHNRVTQTATVHLLDFEAGRAHEYEVPIEDLGIFMVELYTIHEIEGTTMSTITESPEVVAQLQRVKTLPGVTLEVTSEQVTARVFSGDDKADVTFDADKVISAIAGLLKANGFKSRAITDEDAYSGELHMMEWIADFRYGFTRRSDEQLAAELEGILQPEIGAW